MLKIDEDEKWESKNIINKKKAKETIEQFDTSAKVDAASGRPS